MSLIKVSLLATDRAVWQGQASSVVLRTLDGELGILAGHVPMLSSLAVGPVVITAESGEKVAAAVHGGFVTVDNNEVTIFAQRCELKGEIDVTRATAAVAQSDDPEQVKRNQVRLAVANN
ncbi:MAG: F0F1 ATP synthase subunit epsilon [Actinomycetota bacterium]|nr:F0F1 ATP synthase subunit epsilon [Actinomycetota bacterium]